MCITARQRRVIRLSKLSIVMLASGMVSRPWFLNPGRLGSGIETFKLFYYNIRIINFNHLSKSPLL
jgi:hypothetical protein